MLEGIVIVCVKNVNNDHSESDIDQNASSGNVDVINDYVKGLNLLFHTFKLFY